MQDSAPVCTSPNSVVPRQLIARLGAFRHRRARIQVIETSQSDRQTAVRLCLLHFAPSRRAWASSCRQQWWAQRRIIDFQCTEHCQGVSSSVVWVGQESPVNIVRQDCYALQRLLVQVCERLCIDSFSMSTSCAHLQTHTSSVNPAVYHRLAPYPTCIPTIWKSEVETLLRIVLASKGSCHHESRNTVPNSYYATHL
jgi:hypothetical protein